MEYFLSDSFLCFLVVVNILLGLCNTVFKDKECVCSFVCQN